MTTLGYSAHFINHMSEWLQIECLLLTQAVYEQGTTINWKAVSRLLRTHSLVKRKQNSDFLSPKVKKLHLY